MLHTHKHTHTPCILCLSEQLGVQLCREALLCSSICGVISRVTITYFLLPCSQTSPHLVSSSLHLVSLLIFSLLTFCHPLLCSLSTFFSSPPSSRHEFPNCLHFLFAPSLSLEIYWIYIHPSTQFSVLVILSECFSCHCCVCVCVYIHADQSMERGIRGDE